MRNPAIVKMEDTSDGVASDGVASLDSDRGAIAAVAYQLWNDSSVGYPGPAKTASGSAFRQQEKHSR